jgi:hypothetical protein
MIERECKQCGGFTEFDVRELTDFADKMDAKMPCQFCDTDMMTQEERNWTHIHRLSSMTFAEAMAIQGIH